ncbi:hypothetical protein H257_00594 [Aphanomyces astaci]|uniref:Uncharacterized protein n=1 Tax=Aphanomyces astaci TaxID=112090 RepID=W4HBC3_APHAT|nr:hypothetical protein H257_00594 [Aphanomyces astaci]ETV89237.1 hypothetical protein H257_00594 [Aphanomyces astaci]|eukprot:XP_009821637.1 hypothetical protein H257_00594 [Aphanomyces astaci]
MRSVKRLENAQSSSRPFKCDLAKATRPAEEFFGLRFAEFVNIQLDQLQTRSRYEGILEGAAMCHHGGSLLFLRSPFSRERRGESIQGFSDLFFQCLLGGSSFGDREFDRATDAFHKASLVVGSHPPEEKRSIVVAKTATQKWRLEPTVEEVFQNTSMSCHKTFPCRRQQRQHCQ